MLAIKAIYYLCQQNQAAHSESGEVVIIFYSRWGIEGYVTLPSGVIIEWGSISYPESKDYISNVSFLKNPITVIAAFISEENTQTGGAQYRGGSTIKHSSVSSTGMTITIKIRN